MILPTKGLRPDRALLTVGAEILAHLVEPKTITRLWRDMQMREDRSYQLTFDWFVLAVDLLFVVGAVTLEDGRIRKVAQATEAKP